MENQPQIKIPDSVLKENQKHACKSTKKERRKRLMKFADTATKHFGKPRIGGQTYCCFDCIHHKTSDKKDNVHICVLCNNGHYFEQK